MNNSPTTDRNFMEAWNVLLDKWACMGRCIEGLGKLWEGERPAVVLQSLEEAQNRSLKLEHCVAENGLEAASLSTCRDWLEEVREAFEDAEALAEGMEDVERIREYGRKILVLQNYLDALEAVWPEGWAMVDLLGKAEPLLARLVEGEEIEGSVADVFASLLEQTATVWQVLAAKKAEEAERKLQQWGWTAETVRHITAWHQRAWQIAKSGLGEAATRAIGLEWLEALAEITLIQDALEQAGEIIKKEATGKSLGDIVDILDKAINQLSPTFERWVGQEIVHVAELLAEAPAEALERLREILGKPEGMCRKVSLPGREEGGEGTCAQVAQAWQFLQKIQGSRTAPKHWQARYQRLSAAEKQLAALVAQWEKVAAILAQVKEKTTGRKRIEDYQVALDMLKEARAAWPGHSEYETTVKHWLEGPRRWAKRQARGKSAEVKAVRRKLEAWDLEGAEDALETLKKTADAWQAALKRLENESPPIALSGDVKAKLAEIAQQLGHELETPRPPQGWQSALAEAQEAFEKARQKWESLQKEIEEAKRRREEALAKVRAWKDALEKTEKSRKRVSEELEAWRKKDQRYLPKAQDLPEVQELVRWLAEQKEPEELWHSAWTSYKAGRYEEAWRDLQKIKEKDVSGEFQHARQNYAERYGQIRWAAQWEKASHSYDEQDYETAYRLMQEVWGEINVEVQNTFRTVCSGERKELGEEWEITCKIYNEWEDLQKIYQQGREKERNLKTAWGDQGWMVPIRLPLSRESTETLTRWFGALGDIAEQARFLEVTAQYTDGTTTPVYWHAWYREVQKRWGKQLLQYYRQEARALVKRAGWKQALALWERAKAVLPDEVSVAEEKDYAAWYVEIEKCVERWQEKEPWTWEETAAEVAKWCGECKHELDKQRQNFSYVQSEEKVRDLAVLGQWQRLFQQGEEDVLAVWDAWEAHKPVKKWSAWREKSVPFYRLWQAWWREWIKHLLAQAAEEKPEKALYDVLASWLAAHSLGEEPLKTQARDQLMRLLEPPGVKEEWQQQVSACAEKVASYQNMALGESKQTVALGSVYCRWSQCLEEINRLQKYQEGIIRAAKVVGETNADLEFPQQIDAEHRKHLALAVEALKRYRLSEKLRKGERISVEGGGGGGIEGKWAKGIAGVAVEVIEKWRRERRTWRKVLQQGLERLAAVYYSDEMAEGNPYLSGLHLLWKETPGENGKPIRPGLAQWVENILEALKQELREEQEACKGKDAEGSRLLESSDTREPLSPDDLSVLHLFTYLGVTSQFPINGKEMAQWEEILKDVKAQAENIAYYTAVKTCVEQRQEDLKRWQASLRQQPRSIYFYKQMAWVQEQLRRMAWWYAVDWKDLEGLVRWRQSPVKDRVGEGECLTEEITVAEVTDWQKEARASSPGAPSNRAAEVLAQHAREVLDSIRDTVTHKGEEKMLIRRCQQAWEEWVAKLEQHLRSHDWPRVRWAVQDDESVKVRWERIMDEAEKTVQAIANAALQRQESAILRPVASLLLQYNPEEPLFQWMCEATECEPPGHKTQGTDHINASESNDDYYGPAGESTSSLFDL